MKKWTIENVHVHISMTNGEIKTNTYNEFNIPHAVCDTGRQLNRVTFETHTFSLVQANEKCLVLRSSISVSNFIMWVISSLVNTDTCCRLMRFFHISNQICWQAEFTPRLNFILKKKILFDVTFQNIFAHLTPNNLQIVITKRTKQNKSHTDWWKITTFCINFSYNKKIT